MIYEFPAIIKYDFNEKVYYVNFPDMSNCFTDGENLHEALNNAEDVLNLMLLNAECKGEKIPTPTNIEKIGEKNLGHGEIVALIKADTDLYSKISKIAV